MQYLKSLKALIEKKSADRNSLDGEIEEMKKEASKLENELERIDTKNNSDNSVNSVEAERQS